jgi:phosphoglycerate dehydrogenase-like enzyme
VNIVLVEPLSVPDVVIENAKKEFEKYGHKFTAYSDRKEDPETLIERIADADVVILTNIPFPASIIEGCKNLKMISVAFTGVDHIDLEACKKRGITVSNAAGFCTDSVAELVIGHILMKLRNLLECDEAVRNGETRAGLVGTTLKGKTLGIVGTGAIGLRVAEIASVFGCRLLGWSRSKRDEAVKAGLEYVSIETLFQESDIISLHVPLTDGTKNLVDHKLLSKMKSNALLINASRGAVVDSSALSEALNGNEIGGACIDTFETEPPIKTDHALLNSDKTILAPHVAFATDESFKLRAEIVFNNIRTWIDGNPVNKII